MYLYDLLCHKLLEKKIILCLIEMGRHFPYSDNVQKEKVLDGSKWAEKHLTGSDADCEYPLDESLYYRSVKFK